MSEERKVSAEQVIEELVAIGFAKVTDFLCVEDNMLVLKPTSQLEPGTSAAIASIERTSNGLKVKFYDKLKALELLGKCIGLFDGKLPQDEKSRNNLLEAFLEATRKEIDIRDIPEIQQATDTGYELVESAGAEEL